MMTSAWGCWLHQRAYVDGDIDGADEREAVWPWLGSGMTSRLAEAGVAVVRAPISPSAAAGGAEHGRGHRHGEGEHGDVDDDDGASWGKATMTARGGARRLVLLQLGPAQGGARRTKSSAAEEELRWRRSVVEGRGGGGVVRRGGGVAGDNVEARCGVQR